MKLNKDYIRELVFKQGWSQTEFAEKLGMSRSEVNRFFNGRRAGGSKLAGNIVRVFANEPMDKLFYFNIELQTGK